MSGNISAEERKALLQWAGENEANRQFFDEMIQLWSISGEADEPFETDAEEAWSALEEKLPADDQDPGATPPKVVRLKKKRFDWRIAAAVAILLTGAWWIVQPFANPPQNEILAEQLNDAPHTLPDGSKVWLNEDSRLTYDPRFNKRNITLEGEAFFEIARDERRPFSVQAGSARTTVLGTSFNLRAYPEEDRVELAVKTGRVKFESLKNKNEEAAATLEKGQAAYLVKESPEPVLDETISGNTTAWMTDTLVFDNDQMYKVINDLRKYFRIDIQVEDEGAYDCNFNSTFPQPKLEYVFEELEEAIEGISVTRQGEVYILKGKCDQE